MLDRHLIYGLGESADAKNADLETLLRNLNRYPKDFTDGDFLSVIEFLSEHGEYKEAAKVKASMLADRYNGSFINIAQIQKDFYENYFNGDSFSDNHFNYEWCFDTRDDVFVITYTNKETGNSGANGLPRKEFLSLSQADFEKFVNESIFYDQALNEEPEREE